MSFGPELLVLACVPLALTAAVLLVGHLATLRGLRGDQRVDVYRILADAVTKRRR
ncbi:hypothetical protein [Streptomyces griseocarneus]|uniref:hypothetical protein n=1 Tax=Streptomyces griseocarneus TaxID=51201 RepID=UPI00167EF9F3|nr:hypothetical protein [Streptomyces griseocarneus]MBZ6471837.1 hypothetical protein [Streptomyces griseocarneus]GHG71134.1 hypothetical protein GCM10018779_45570 [Streptomyces griseocarneus]